ncbi:tetratricopeptide repeat protein [Geopsychrobacter electrodiphilus]|uniref:tetratricopeptide repeat protein n=1 Tax=Geopsychrobacter electrodiphilus TaxID=225196 RepID=UPI00036C9A18|nr:tetratricopeptide repeat protein [Geopsychrobacter electrodiphilus]
MSYLKTWGSGLLLGLACLAVYGQTLDIPWYLDDLPGIVENPLVKSVSASLAQVFQPRGLSTLSFSLNHYFGLFEPAGYHLVNVLLHLLVSWLVFLLLARVCNFKRWVSLCGALLFLVHPVQTQAVNYVVQRSTLLAAFFVLLSILSFFAAEQTLSPGSGATSKRRYWFLYLLALLSGACAVLTKQNTATLPLLLFLLGCYRQTHSSRWLALRIAPFFVAPVMVLVYMVLLPVLSGEGLARVASTHLLANLEGTSPLHYFATELSVLPLYIKLILYPVNLRLDYAYPIVTQIFTVKNISLFAGHAAVLGSAFWAQKRQRALSFAILWFYAALLVESSFIPLDPVFEHRLYLPIIGPIVLFCALLDWGRSRTRWIVAGAGALILVCGVLSWNRNELWRHPIAFAEHDASKSPYSEGPWVALSGQYMKVGRLAEARKALERALEINPQYPLIYVNLSSISLRQGNPVSAQNEALAGLRHNPGNEKLQRNLAIAFLQSGELSRGVALLDGLARRHPEDYSLRVLIGQAYIDQKQWGQAEKWLKNAVDIGTDGDPLPYYLLGVISYQQKNLKAAADYLRRALQLKGQDVAMLKGLGLVLLESGDFAGAREQVKQLEGLDKRAAESLRTVIQSVRTPSVGAKP